MTTTAVRQTAPGEGPGRVIQTRIPARLDRLPWSGFHWRIILGLGTVWILDGLEVTNVGNVSSRLTSPGSGISITVQQIGFAGAFYVAGACFGALFFGHLTDRFGRKKLFMITLGVYILSTALTAFSVTAWMFILFRFMTGTGIGGEYASINSAIDELIPARARGRVDLSINGSYWAGAIIASGLSLFWLSSYFPTDLGWRLAFGVGVVLGFAVLLVRRNVPESPRWLFIHGREEEAEAIVGDIEHQVEQETGESLSQPERSIRVRPRDVTPFREIARTAFRTYPRRSVLCLALFIGQAFLYNGITFNLGDLMTTFFGVASGTVPVFIVLYGISNLSGPLLLGRLFDSVGRKQMIAGTYLGSAVLGVVLAILFLQTGLLGPWSFIVMVMATFFLASSGASAAYLTTSEIFPMETRALSIAFFYAVGTAVGGIVGSLLFGNLIATAHRSDVAIAFLIGAAVMAVGGITEILFGVRAEQAQLEDIAAPLTEVTEGDETAGATGPELAGEQLEVARARERAASERARAAEHRASAHDHMAVAAQGNPAAGERADIEGTLGEIAERTALAYDEYASQHEELAAAEVAEDESEAAVARRRAEAARERARAHEEDARVLEADDEAGAAVHRALADAALERARRREQEALAEQARQGTGVDEDDPATQTRLARSRMHDSWARMHGERALAAERRAAGDEAAAGQADRTAAVMEEQGRAEAFRVEAAERRAEADEDRRSEQSAERTAEDAVRRRAQLEAQRAAEERIRARLERSRGRQAGLGRYRPGPGRISSFPGIGESTPLPEEALDDQIQAVEQAVAEHGPVERAELARLVGARYWGPGVLAEAIRQAVAEGGLRRISRTVYGPTDRLPRQGNGSGGTDSRETADR